MIHSNSHMLSFHPASMLIKQALWFCWRFRWQRFIGLEIKLISESLRYGCGIWYLGVPHPRHASVLLISLAQQRALIAKRSPGPSSDSRIFGRQFPIRIQLQLQPDSRCLSKTSSQQNLLQQTSKLEPCSKHARKRCERCSKHAHYTVTYTMIRGIHVVFSSGSIGIVSKIAMPVSTFWYCCVRIRWCTCYLFIKQAPLFCWRLQWDPSGNDSN